MNTPSEVLPLTMEERTKALFERMMIVVIVLALLHFVEDFINDTALIWVMDLMVVVAAVGSYLTHKAGHMLFGRLLAFFLLVGIIFYFAAGTHARNNIHWHFFSVFAITAIIFRKKQFKLGVLLILLVYCTVVYLDLNSYTLGWFPEIGNSERSTLSVLINISSSVLILTYAIMSLLDASEKNEIRMIQEIKNVKKLNQELDSFVYSASHDLKAPLSSLRGLITLVKSEKDPAMLDLYHSKMESTIEQSEAFIQNITNYSRNVRIDPKPEKINLREFLQTTYSDLSFGNGQPSIRLDLDLDSEFIHTDKNRLQAIFGNLISNSIKYADRQKPECWIRISKKEENGTYLIHVEDNGIGIEEEHLPKLFNMFYRASELSTGSGLGLYIVSESLEKLGGRISVESVSRRGTQFKLIIPKAD